MRSIRLWSLRLLCAGLVWLPLNAGAQSSEASPGSCRPLAGDKALADSVTYPFWKSSHMDAETVLFELHPGETAATATLLFAPTRVVRVTSATGETVFEQGRDYLFTPGSNVLTLAPNSRIPFKTTAELHPPMSSPDDIGVAVGGKMSLLFHEGPPFQALEAAVTYEHKKTWEGYTPPSKTAALARTRAKLKSRQPFKLVVLGDSISTGASASQSFCKPPFQPGFAELVANALRVKHSAPVTLKNLSVGGKAANWGVTEAAHAAEEHPDLVIIGFGMNDASGGVSVEDYSRDLEKIMATVRSSSPDADFILVATWPGNPEWAHSDWPRYEQYRQALSRLAGPGVAMADLTSLFEEILKTKKFDDLTGNGLNHPNDFGHTIYAQAILQLIK
jgi:lysophospholipase L1-like esterase